jgi:hypothetical protein
LVLTIATGELVRVIARPAFEPINALDMTQYRRIT